MSYEEFIVEQCRDRQGCLDTFYFDLGVMASRSSLLVDYEPLTPEGLYEHDKLRQADNDPHYGLGIGDMQGEIEWMNEVKSSQGEF